MKTYLKNTDFISVDNMKFDSNILLNKDYIFIYTNYLNHTLYYKVIDIIREYNLKLIYLNVNTNEKIVLKQIYENINKDNSSL